MRSEDKMVENIGRVLENALGTGHSRELLESQKRALLNVMNGRNKRSRQFPWMQIGLSVAAAIVLVSIGTFFIQREHETIPYAVGGESVSSDGWVRNRLGASISINFENGTRFALAPRSIARVVESKKRTVRIELGDGSLSANVHGNGKTDWIVLAGPYVVKAVGTRFSVGWMAKRGALDVNVSNGRVSVNGIGLGTQGVILEAGYYLRAESKRRHVEINATISRNEHIKTVGGDAPDKSQTRGAPDTPKKPEQHNARLAQGTESFAVKHASRDAFDSLTSHTEPDPSVHIAQPIEPENQTKPLPTWERLYRLGDLTHAVAALNPEELDVLEKQTDLDVIWKMANAARHSKRPAIASRLFEVIRRRDNGTIRAQISTYFLGKIALESNRDLDRSRRWFTLYLKETPNGELVEEALGNLIEICDEADRNDEAIQWAKRYLDHYENGLFSRRARKVLETRSGSKNK